MTTVDDRAFLPAMPRPALLPLYDPFSRLLGARDAQWQLVAQAGIEPRATVVEIGCGTGNVLLLARRAAPGATLVGLDPDPRALAIAARKAQRAGAEIRFDRGYADRLPYPDGTVDRVLSAFMLHHLPVEQQHGALREVRRVLAPGGRLHVLDLDSGEPAAAGRLLRRGHRGHAHDGHRHRGHGSVPLLAALAEAGFVDATETGQGATRFGRHAFHRATR